MNDFGNIFDSDIENAGCETIWFIFGAWKIEFGVGEREKEIIGVMRNKALFQHLCVQKGMNLKGWMMIRNGTSGYVALRTF